MSSSARYGSAAVGPLAGGGPPPPSAARGMFATLGFSCGLCSFTGLVFLVCFCPPHRACSSSSPAAAPLCACARACIRFTHSPTIACSFARSQAFLGTATVGQLIPTLDYPGNDALRAKRASSLFGGAALAAACMVGWFTLWWLNTRSLTPQRRRHLTVGSASQRECVPQRDYTLAAFLLSSPFSLSLSLSLTHTHTLFLLCTLTLSLAPSLPPLSPPPHTHTHHHHPTRRLSALLGSGDGDDDDSSWGGGGAGGVHPTPGKQLVIN